MPTRSRSWWSSKPALPSPPGWTWVDIDPEVIERLEPETCRAAVDSWAVERAEGWSRLRPAWSRPGWLARASAWMVDQMEAVGHPVVDVPRLHQLWGLSVVLRAHTAAGDVFFKCSADVFRHEAVLTQALARLMPDLVPEVIAVDATEGWMLMRDLGASELGEQEESSWHEGVVALAEVQQSWLGHADELVTLGLPIRSLTELAARVEGWTADAELLARMTPALRDRWLATGPSLVEACRGVFRPDRARSDSGPWRFPIPGTSPVAPAAPASSTGPTPRFPTRS